MNSKNKNRPNEVHGYTDILGASEITGLSTSVLYKKTSNETIKFYKPSGKLLFKIDELKEWIEANGSIKQSQINE